MPVYQHRLAATLPKTAGRNRPGRPHASVAPGRTRARRPVPPATGHWSCHCGWRRSRGASRNSFSERPSRIPRPGLAHCAIAGRSSGRSSACIAQRAQRSTSFAPRQPWIIGSNRCSMLVHTARSRVAITRFMTRWKAMAEGIAAILIACAERTLHRTWCVAHRGLIWRRRADRWNEPGMQGRQPDAAPRQSPRAGVVGLAWAQAFQRPGIQTPPALLIGNLPRAAIVHAARAYATPPRIGCHGFARRSSVGTARASRLRLAAPIPPAIDQRRSTLRSRHRGAGPFLARGLTRRWGPQAWLSAFYRAICITILATHACVWCGCCHCVPGAAWIRCDLTCRPYPAPKPKLSAIPPRPSRILRAHTFPALFAAVG